MRIKEFLSSKGPKLATLVTLLFGILIFTIYFTGYHAVPNHIDRLPVTLVNQDPKSKHLATQLKQKLPFHDVKQTSNLNTAKKELDNRKSYFVIAIPKNFSADVKANHKTNLEMYTNDANPSLVNSSVKLAAQKIGQTVTQNITMQKATFAFAKPQLGELQQDVQKKKAASADKLKQAQQKIASAPAAQQQTLTDQLNQQITDQKKQATQQANQQKQTIIASAKKQATNLSNSVQVKLHRENVLHEGLNYAMAPFFFALALYLGTMIASLVLYGTYAKFAAQIGRFHAFADLEITFVIVSAISSLVNSLILMSYIGFDGTKFLPMFVSHWLYIWTAFNITAMMYLLLGQMGATVNIFVTMIQIVASGGLFPAILMNGFFKLMHAILPMSYIVGADFDTFYTNNSITNNMFMLILILLGAIIINLIIVTLRKKQTMIDFHDLS